MSNERVEEIRQAHERWHAEGWSRQGCHQCDLLTALAQAEREQEEYAEQRYREGKEDGQRLERDALRAEVERLKVIEERAKHMLYVAGCRDDGINEEMRILWRVLGIKP